MPNFAPPVNHEQSHSHRFIADNDTDDRDMLSDVFGELMPELKLQYVHDGNELLRFLEYLLPDLLFIDLEMPRKNGLECIREIRAQKAIQDLPIIVFSSTTRPANVQTAYEIGADLIMVKPLTFNDFRKSVQLVLSFDWSKLNAVTEQYLIDGHFTPLA